jgi:regulator of protease activity HflC (stomatin/prohibitin superfamily)
MATEKIVSVQSGWKILLLLVALLVVGCGALIIGFTAGFGLICMPLALLLVVISCIIGLGFFTLQPNEARVLVLFGNYHGTVIKDGFHWSNPFYQRNNDISLRARTYNGDQLKVNDRDGNPIEIGEVIVWRVLDTAKAVFAVDNYSKYVTAQSETALRHVATSYAYDHSGDGEDGQITLRSDIEKVSLALKNELTVRLEPAGVVVDDARLTHLAYAPEIAQVMLRRQQADAVIAARSRIVYGAVSMVEMALKQLAEKNVIDLDDERKAVMVSNLLVVLCAENEMQPVINTGTLYQ